MATDNEARWKYDEVCVAPGEALDANTRALEGVARVDPTHPEAPRG